MNHTPIAAHATPSHTAQQRLRLALGIVVLAIGSLVYLIDRPAHDTFFVSQSLSLFNNITPVFGVLGQHLPTFSHALALVLITAAVGHIRRRGYLLVCGIWLLIDGLFELGQQPRVSALIVANIPEVMQDLPILSHTVNYFQNGRYDPLDMASIVAGVVAAYFVLRFTEK